MRVSSAVFITLCITNQLLFLISDHKNGDRRGIEGAMVLASYKIVGNFSTKCFQFGDTFVIDFCNLCLVHVLFMNPELAHSYPA